MISEDHQRPRGGLQVRARDDRRGRGPGHDSRALHRLGPKPMVAVDIFRVKNGKLVEHWDVMQEEVAAAATKSGNPMFPIAP